MQMQAKYNDRIPGEGTNIDLFERLSSYINIVDKDWTNRIKPANKDSISQLSKLSGIENAGLDFPETYKVFLNYMGECDGDVFGPTLLGQISITDILELYKDLNEYEPDAINPLCLAFVSTHTGTQISFDLRQPDNPNIVKSSDGEISDFFSESFEKLLFQYSLIRYEKIYYPEAITFGGSQIMLKSALTQHKTDNIFDIVDMYAKSYSFKKAWFSDKKHYFGIRDDATFYVRGGVSTVSGRITGFDRSFLNEFASILTSNIGAETDK